MPPQQRFLCTAALLVALGSAACGDPAGGPDDIGAVDTSPDDAAELSRDTGDDASGDADDADVADTDASLPDADASDAVDTRDEELDADPSDADAADMEPTDADTSDSTSADVDPDSVDADAGDGADTGPADALDAADASDAADVEDPPPTCSDGETSGRVTFTPELLVASATTVDNSVANVRVADLSGDGSMQLFLAQPFLRQVLWLHGCADASDASTCQRTPLLGDLTAPVRATTVDLDADGDIDVLISDIGRVPPTDLFVGGVIVLRNTDGTLVPEVLLAGLKRTSCAEPADVDGDGRLDIVLCEFGHTTGNTRILWQEEDGSFTNEVLRDRAGTIHAWPVDVDADGDLDIVASISQQYEEIVLFRNAGGRVLEAEVIFEAGDMRFGMSGCQIVDLDGDGDPDVVYTNGDTLDSEDLADVEPWEFHGVGWLENDGTGRFTHARIGGHWSAYSAVVGDFDLDCDLDVVSAALQVPEQFPDERLQGVVWFENDGAQNFTRHDLFEQPAAVITSTGVDFDRDGDMDVVLGTFDVGRLDTPERALLLRNGAADDPGLGAARIDPDAATLGSTGLFAGEPAAHRLAGRGFSYDVRSPLWTDGSLKWRAVALPEGTRATTADDGSLRFPDGTVLIKSFGFPHAGRVAWIETRLLWLRDGSWQARSFRWREDGTDADRFDAGGQFAVAGSPSVWPMPSEADCATCHGIALRPVGTRLAQLGDVELAGTEQLARLEAAGFLELPPDDEGRAPLTRPDDVAASIEDRARSWLDGNCAHCHRQGGTATRGGLWLDAAQESPGALGICRVPAAGGPVPEGTTHLIVPGAPEQSALLARMVSGERLVRMPEIGTNVIDELGVELVSAWIASMEPDDCAP